MARHGPAARRSVSVPRIPPPAGERGGCSDGRAGKAPAVPRVPDGTSRPDVTAPLATRRDAQSAVRIGRADP